jgi:hypothetical protein
MHRFLLKYLQSIPDYHLPYFPRRNSINHPGVARSTQYRVLHSVREPLTHSSPRIFPSPKRPRACFFRRPPKFSACQPTVKTPSVPLLGTVSSSAATIIPDPDPTWDSFLTKPRYVSDLADFHWGSSCTDGYCAALHSQWNPDGDGIVGDTSWCCRDNAGRRGILSQQRPVFYITV